MSEYNKCIKQHLSNIWRSIHKNFKPHWGWVEKKKKALLIKKACNSITAFSIEKVTKGLIQAISIIGWLIFSALIWVFKFSHVAKEVNTCTFNSYFSTYVVDLLKRRRSNRLASALWLLFSCKTYAICVLSCFFNPVSASPTKWSNKLKLPTNCLSVFDYFVKLTL